MKSIYYLSLSNLFVYVKELTEYYELIEDDEQLPILQWLLVLDSLLKGFLLFIDFIVLLISDFIL